MNRRFLPLAAAVLIPMAVIVGFALQGLKAQRRVAWSDAQEDARQLAELRSDKFTNLLKTRYLNGGFRYPDPPIPTAPTQIDSVLEGEDLVALRKLRDDPQVGLTTSGLPKRVIAAFRLHQRTRQPIDALELLKVATVERPSVLTPLAFDQVSEIPEEKATYEKVWKGVKSANEVLRRHPEISKAGKWFLDEGNLWWMALDGDFISFISLGPPSEIPIPRGAAVLSRPWEEVRITLGDKILDGPEGVLLASSRVAIQPISPSNSAAEPPYLTIEIVTRSPLDVHAAVTRQATWTLGVLGGSTVIALIGLFMIHRLMARERKLNELKSNFVASVSHELRAPVGSIRLMANALDAGKVSPETAADFHRLISREGKRLTNLIENVLDFARIEQGRKRWHFEAADLPALVSDTVKVMEPLAAEKRIALGFIHQVFDAEPVLDSAAIQQALVNLLDNAIKFSPPDSGIETILSSDERYWRLAVRDHGAGIPTSERKKIFERFYRPGDELRRETQGTGIGLSLVKAIAEAHGGQVELESQPGHGSTFTLVIPIDATAGH